MFLPIALTGSIFISYIYLAQVIYRPSLIWNWSKLDVLPIIPFFNLASALGVPFVDKTVINQLYLHQHLHIH